MRQTAYIAILTVLIFAPAIASAAIVTVSDDTILVLPSDNSQYTLANGSTFEALFIDSGGASFTFNMTGGESVTLTSADKRTLTSNPAFTVTCGTTQSSVTLTLPTGAPAQPVIVTPGNTCSGASGGGSPSVGQVTPTPTSTGGGGGGSPPPAPAPIPGPKLTAPTPSGVGAASAAGLPPVAVLVQSVFFKNLSQGNRGDAVRELQTLLSKDKTIYPEGIINGVFGPATTRAVKRFQKKYGILQTGITGPLTRAKLQGVFGKTPVPTATPSVPSVVPTPQVSTLIPLLSRNMTVGSQGQDVRQLQTWLATDSAIYPEGVVNGTFGPATLRAVKRFQKKYGISTTGTVGPQTRAKLQEVFGQ